MLSARALGISLTLAAAMGLGAPAPLAAQRAAGGGMAHATARRIVITVLHNSASHVPDSFFGLSTEYPALPRYLIRPRIFERVLSLLRVGGDGPLVLRIGGDSADRTYWNPGPFPLPLNSTILSERWFQRAAALASDLDLRVLFDLNVRHSTPALSAGLAGAAVARMPAGSIAGFEIGNEPNRYRHGYSAEDYTRDFRLFAAAVGSVAPGLPRIGPASGDSGSARSYGWLRGVIFGDRDVLDVLTAHRYPLRACDPPRSRLYPTVTRLLSSRTAAEMMRPIESAVHLARLVERPFRLDEFNSVTCGGRPGVSDTFATALWAPDALFRLLRAGVAGVNVHIRPQTINAPFRITGSGLHARPLLYGLILFVRALTPAGKLVRIASGPRPASLGVWVVRVSRNRLRVLLINKGEEPVNTFLRLPGSGSASVERLLARSAASRTGVTLDGQHLGREGNWEGRRTVSSIRRKAGGYEVMVPKLSGALVSFRLPA